MERFKNINRLKDSLGSAAEKSQAASKKVMDKAASAAGQVQDAAGKTLDSAAEKSQAASRKALDTAASAAGQVQDAAGKTLDATTSVAAGTIAQSQEIYNQALDKLFPECPVTAFMLPTGPNPEDYVIIFGLDDMLDNLKSGIFVRPKLEVWAGRDSGYDLDRFGQEVKQHFVRQFNQATEARGRQIESAEAHIDKLESHSEQVSNEIGRNVTGSVLWTTTGLGLTSLGFIAWPLLPMGLLFLAFGMGSMTQLTRLVPNYLNTRSKTGNAKRELDRELKELESQFDSKNEAFQRAVRNIDVRVHPRIREITEIICEVEGVVFLPGDVSSAPVGIPNVEPFLKYPAYLERLPDHYRKLVHPDWNATDSGKNKKGLFTRLLGS